MRHWRPLGHGNSVCGKPVGTYEGGAFVSIVDCPECLRTLAFQGNPAAQRRLQELTPQEKPDDRCS